MTPFLKQVASHYHSEGSLDRKCFIFPNKRSLTFFKKYLGDAVRQSGVPVTAPLMLTMNEFFFILAERKSADRVHLLLRLYDSYRKFNARAESLDDFIFWGDVLLSDFDDVDKYLVDASGIFTNVAQFKGMRDSFSYLTPTQEEAVRRFVSHFEKDGRIKAEFRHIWDLLLPLYRDFRESLDREGLSYEGQVYRSTVERMNEESAPDVLARSFPDADKFIFVGLNALNECEKTLMRKCANAGMAEFCWDYSGPMTTDRNNKSSLFLSSFIQEFPQAFELQDDNDIPRIRVISVPSTVGQAKQLPALLSEQPGIPGIDTAIILPDEKMLVPVLNSIPGDISKLNVTMGYAMSGSSLWSLMNDIAAMQLHIREREGEILFYHKQVRAIFSNSLFKTVLSEEEKDRVKSVKDESRYYIPMEKLGGTPLFDRIFKPAGEDVQSIAQYQQDIISSLAPQIRDNAGMSLELDFARDLYLAIGKLKSYGPDIKPVTYYRLLGQVAAGMAVPFKGEPLEGLQIMGPLETRALDFDNVIILNCNEGIFPRHSVRESFIPPELRKAFGLPTYEHQDAVWAYYFYRLIRRAKQVTMLYDSRAEGTRSGEESRYIKQLELHFGVPVERFTAKAPLRHTDNSDDIPKTEAHIEALRSGHLSATALENYLKCQAKFYYKSVCGLKEDEDVNESLDSGTMGTVFHNTMEELYNHRESITAAYLRSLLSDRERIKECVDRHIMETLRTFEISGRNLLFEDMVCRYVVRVLSSDLELLDRYGVPSFKILGLERKVSRTIGGFKFVGYIDRLDSFSPGEVRIVDYKTGKVTDNDFIINEDNAEKVVGDLFGDNVKERPNIALQLYLYDIMSRGLEEVRGRSIVNSIYQPARLFTNEVENVALNDRFCTLMDGKVNALLEQIADTGRPWTRTKDAKSCSYCKFRNICGR